MKHWVHAATLAALLIMPGVALAQKPVTVADVVTATVTIEAINSAARTVTLKDKDGLLEEIYCGPDVQRFDALKVGDRVTFSYHESIVSAIHKPAPGAPEKSAVSSGITRTPGATPGGTIARQMTAIVTIEAIDAKVPSVAIKAADGRQMSFRVQDPKNLEGYKVGDKVEITYTQALAISVTPAGK